MSDKKDTKAKKEKQPFSFKRLLWKLTKITVVLAVIIFILLTVLSRLGGDSDILKESIEEFLTANTPYTGHVGTLKGMGFFPYVYIDVENVELRYGDDGTGETAIRAASAQLAVGFFDVMFKDGHFKKIDIRNIDALPGAILAPAVKIDAVEIITEDEKSYLSMAGNIGQTPLLARTDLVTKGSGSRPTYAFDGDRVINVALGKTTLSGTLKTKPLGGSQLENATLTHKDKTVLRGNFDMNMGDTSLDIKGQARIEPNKSHIDPNIKIDWSDTPTKISGKVQSAAFNIDDLSDEGLFLKTIDEISKTFSPPGAKPSKTLGLAGITLDINAAIQNVKSGAFMTGNIETPIKLKDAKLEIGPLKGKISNGTLSGNIEFNDASSPAKMKTKVKIKDFDYAALQKQTREKAKIKGKADIIIDLTSQGTSWSAINKNAKGKVGFVGGEGEMQAQILDIWGGGLLNALLPKLKKEEDLNLQCVVANFDIENQQATSDSVFIDTRRITLRAKGVYNIANDNLDMVLEPKAKDIAIGDLSAAINLSGPLSDLNVTPNLFSVGKKVGGLLLGAVNPAIYAVMLTDLGLRDNHPCKAYVIEKEALPPPEKKTETKVAPKEDEPAEAVPTPKNRTGNN